MTPQLKINLMIALLMSFAMSTFFAGFFTYLAFGPTPQWLASWARGFAIGWPLGFLIAVAIGKPVRTIALRLSGVPTKAA